ncbi:MAG: cytochrome c biogenesis heme-transporting ATPase CcmA [Methylotetracoccus sp.]
MNTPHQDPELRAVDLECVRGDRVLFSRLHFDLAAGHILFVEGANGAGKTSLLRILAGLSPPADGEILWRGSAISRNRAAYCADMTYVGHGTGLKAELTPFENLRIWTRLAGVAAEDGAIRDALDRMGLAHSHDIQTRTLSAGQRQRTALTRLLLATARCWILDEPFTALDVTGIERVRELIDAHTRRGGMAVMTSHQALPPAHNVIRLVLG